MYLIHLFLPLYDNDQQPLPKSLFSEVRDGLIHKFGGLTAHSRAPVDGLWQEDGSHAVRTDIRVGRQNPRYLELLEGLEVGDVVITSSYDTFGGAEELEFSKPLKLQNIN